MQVKLRCQTAYLPVRHAPGRRRPTRPQPVPHNRSNRITTFADWEARTHLVEGRQIHGRDGRRWRLAWLANCRPLPRRSAWRWSRTGVALGRSSLYQCCELGLESTKESRGARHGRRRLLDEQAKAAGDKIENTESKLQRDHFVNRLFDAAFKNFPSWPARCSSPSRPSAPTRPCHQLWPM